MPVGIAGTVWAYLSLHDTGVRQPARMDWWGNLTFAVGLVAVLVGITYGIQPYGGPRHGLDQARRCSAPSSAARPCWSSSASSRRGWRIRCSTWTCSGSGPSPPGNLAGLLASLGRGGLMFLLIIWLQGIWLPRHGYSFASTPLWAGIYMLPLTVGFIVAGPVSGWLSDRFGPRRFATGGMVLAALSFVGLMVLPVDFPYGEFAAVLLLSGIGMGLFAAPNRAAIMNSLPPPAARSGRRDEHDLPERGDGALHRDLLQPDDLRPRPDPAARPHRRAHRPGRAGARTRRGSAHCRPWRCSSPRCSGTTRCRACSVLSVLGRLPADHAAFLTGRSFFPALISDPFAHGLTAAFTFAAAACLVAAAASRCAAAGTCTARSRPGTDAT